MVSTCELMECKFIPRSVYFTEIYIMELDPINAVKLFLNKAGLEELKAEEVYQLVNKYPDKFDWSTVAPDKTDKELKEMCSLEKLKKYAWMRIYVLAAHDLFQQLYGNPFSISMLANFYNNPFDAENDLIGLYR